MPESAWDVGNLAFRVKTGGKPATQRVVVHC